jgi:hypothetical protein
MKQVRTWREFVTIGAVCVLEEIEDATIVKLQLHPNVAGFLMTKRQRIHGKQRIAGKSPVVRKDIGCRPPLIAAIVQLHGSHSVKSRNPGKAK